MKRLKNKKGIVLIVAIIVVSLVSVLLTSYVAVTISERRKTEHEVAAVSAEYIAKAGLETTFFDLLSEYEKDENWVDGGASNEINDIEAFVPAVGSGSEDPGNRSDYQNFYVDVDFPNVSDSIGRYTVEIAFVNNADDSAFREGRLWVRSTGTAAETGDSITLIQLAKTRPVKNITQDILYDTLDYSSDSAVDSATADSQANEIRIAGAVLDEDVTIDVTDITSDASVDLIIKGGYGYDFTDDSRDPSTNISILKDTTVDPVVTISGSGTVAMDGVRIE